MKLEGTEFNIDLREILERLQKDTGYFSRGFKESGGDIMVQCPYHSEGQERRPSGGFRKSDGLFHCFACGETHSLPEVISHCYGQDSTGAYGWKWLIQNYGTVSVEERDNVELDFRRTNQISSNSSNSSGVSHRFDNRFVSEEELESYRYIHPYMYKRKLTDEVIELFDIGYDKNTDCITFPIRDIWGNCLFIARRSVKTKYFNYPQGAEKPLYGLYELMKFQYEGSGIQEVIVCESMLDALVFWTVGKYAVALNGLGNELQFTQLRNLPCRKLILATDNDSAGLKARERIRSQLSKYKIITEYIFPPGRKDANDCTQEELLNLQEVF